MSQPSLFVFGPQTTWPTSEYLLQLRDTLLLEPRLKELLSSIKELPQLWNHLIQQDPRLSSVQGAKHLQSIQEWIDQGTFTLTTTVSPNIISMPFTIIIHLVQYFHYLENNPQGLTHAQLLEGAQAGGIQGFCIGLLSALAVGCASNEEDVAKYGSIALRLAASIGAYIDLDSALQCETSVLALRWSSTNSLQLVTNILKNHENVS